ncbi:hypothetical protein D3C86_1208280 [compost metagenome]
MRAVKARNWRCLGWRVEPVSRRPSRYARSCPASPSWSKRVGSAASQPPASEASSPYGRVVPSGWQWAVAIASTSPAMARNSLSRRLLPIPASPWRLTSKGLPLRAVCQQARSWASSLARPMSGAWGVAVAQSR